MGKPVTSTAALHAALALVLSSCLCDPPLEEPVNRNGISEGHMPPELPPLPAATGTSTARSAAKDAAAVPSSASPAPQTTPSGVPELTWTTPPGWRFLGQPSIGPVRAHFHAAEEGREHVDVYVVHQVAARGATAELRLEDAVARESDGFSRVDRKDVTARELGHRKITVVELRGTRREAAANERVQELPDRVQVSALIQTDGFPIRVAMDGRPDLVERCRDAFFAFVGGLQLGSPR